MGQRWNAERGEENSEPDLRLDEQDGQPSPEKRPSKPIQEAMIR